MPEKAIDVKTLVATLDADRRTRKISWRKLAGEAGVSASTLTRMQQGKSPDVNTFTALTRWLNIPAERFTKGKATGSSEEDPVAIISTLLRAQKKLSPKALSALQELVSAAVQLSKELK